MANIELAFAEAKKLLGRPGIHGVSKKRNRIIIYADKGASVPATISGIPTEVIYTERFKVLR